jgi:hypothetical protein
LVQVVELEVVEQTRLAALTQSLHLSLPLVEVEAVTAHLELTEALVVLVVVLVILVLVEQEQPIKVLLVVMAIALLTETLLVVELAVLEAWLLATLVELVDWESRQTSQVRL